MKLYLYYETTSYVGSGQAMVIAAVDRASADRRMEELVAAQPEGDGKGFDTMEVQEVELAPGDAILACSYYTPTMEVVRA